MNDEYELRLESNSGEKLRIGSSTIVRARVFKKGVEVTELVPDHCFRWTRHGEKVKNVETEFNKRYAKGPKAVEVWCFEPKERAFRIECEIVLD